MTVEDSMRMVHISYGRNTPASPQLRSEVAIVAGMAEATVGCALVDWRAYAADYARIRDDIEKVFDDFYDYNVAPWGTPDGLDEYALARPVQHHHLRHG